MHGMGKVRKNKAKEPKKAGTLAAAAKAPKRQGGLWRAVKWTFAKSLKWGTVGAVWAVIAFSVLAAWYATELPDVEQASNATRLAHAPAALPQGWPLVPPQYRAGEPSKPIRRGVG